MYNIEFYETADGSSELWDFIESLRLKAPNNKDARIQHKQIALYIQLLQDNGTRLSENITKHLEDGIWELRPVTIVYSTSFLKRTPTFCCISSARKLKKRHGAKSKMRRQNAPIICPERSPHYENLE